MEGLKSIATDYYNGASAEEKDQVTEFFRKLDTNGDGKVSFAELRDSGIISNKHFYAFNKFDVDYDGVLDLEDIKTLYFFKCKVGEFLKHYKPAKYLCRSRKCKECSTKQWFGPDYSCFWCMHKSSNGTYDFCRRCFPKDVDQSSHQQHPRGLISAQSLALLPVLKKVLFEVEKEMKRQDVRDAMKAVGIGIVGCKVAAGVLAVSACSIM